MGRMTALPSEKLEDKCFSLLTVGLELLVKSIKALHIASIEAYGLGSLAFEPGCNVGIKVGNFSLTAFQTTLSTIRAPGIKKSFAPRSCPHDRVKLPTAIDKGRAITHVQNFQLSVSLSSIYPVKVRHQLAQQEGESVRPRCPPSHGPWYLSKTSSIKVVTWAVVGL